MRDFLAKRHRRPGARPHLFVAGGIAVTVLLLAFVLQQTGDGRQAVRETVIPDYAALLPASATLVGAALELPDLPQSSYVVPYRTGAVTSLALVRWDKDANKYVLTSTAPLSASDPSIGPAVRGTVTLAAEPLGKNAPTAVVASAAVGENGAEYAFFALRNGDALSLATRTTPEGTADTANFMTSAPTPNGVTYSLGDIDGDGDRDVVLDKGADAGDPSVEAYLWNGSGFAYDPELSRTLSLSKSVFPEPEPGTTLE